MTEKGAKIAEADDPFKKLDDFIRSLQNQGILNDLFDQVREIQDEEDPKFVMDSISIYLECADEYTAELTAKLSKPDFDDYQSVRLVAIKLHSGSLSLGVSQVANVAGQLLTAIEAENKAGCLENLEELNRAYPIAKENLNKIYEMEEAIYYN